MMDARTLLQKAIRQRDGMDTKTAELLFMCASDVRVVPMLRGQARRLRELERTLLALEKAIDKVTCDREHVPYHSHSRADNRLFGDENNG